MSANDVREDAQSRATPPYLSFTTFQNKLGELSDHGLPSRIDSSALPGMSGGEASRLISAFRFFELIDGFANEPTVTMRRLLFASDTERQSIYADLLRMCYPPNIVELDLSTVTPNQLDSAFREHGIQGTTLKRAVAFYLRFATEAGIPIGRLLQKSTKPSSPRSSRRRRQQPEADREAPVTYQPPAGTALHTAVFSDGSKLELFGSINPFGLQKRERDFLDRIVEEFQQFKPLGDDKGERVEEE